MIGLELVAGYLAAYAIQKAWRAGKRVDAEVDEFADRLRGLLRELASRDGDRLASSVVHQTAFAGQDSTVNQAGRDMIQFPWRPQA